MATPLTHHLLVSRLQDYWASLATPSLPMFVIAVLVIVACFITLLVRLVMGLSGNLCCKEGTGFFIQPREGGYHKGPILWLKIFLGVACGIAGIGAFLSFAYTEQLGDDLKAYTGVAVDVFNGVVDDVTRVDAVLSDAYYQLPEGARDDMSDVLDDIAELKPTVFCSVPRLWNRIYDKVQAGIREGGIVKQTMFAWAYACLLYTSPSPRDRG